MQRITKDPEIRRQEIIDTAIRLFLDKGYEQTSMLDITKSIHVSSGLCYRYFRSKEEIYQAALDTYVSQGVNYFITLLGDKERSIVEIIDTMPPMDGGEGLADSYHEFFHSSNSFHMQMEIALIDRLIPIVTEHLESAQLKGEIEIGNPASIASFYLYGQLGVWQLKDLEKDVKIQNIRNYIKKLIGV